MHSTLVVVSGPPLPGRWALARAVARRFGARLLHGEAARPLRSGECLVLHADLPTPKLRSEALATGADERVLVDWICSQTEAQREIYHRWVRRPRALAERELLRYREWVARAVPVDESECETVVRVGALAPLADQVLRVVEALRPRPERSPSRPRQPSVLIVEDDGDQRQILGDVLSELGCHVETAPDASVALALLEIDRFDLVISDQRMPGMSGADLAAEVGRRGLHTRVVLLTAHADEVVEQALGGRARNVLCKPVSVVDLQRVIEDVI